MGLRLAFVAAILCIFAQGWTAESDYPLAKWARPPVERVEENDMDSLMILLSSPVEDIRETTAMVLNKAFAQGLHAAQRAVPRLKEMLGSDSSASVRTQCVYALSASGDPDVPDLLITIVENPEEDPFLRSAALYWLMRLEAHAERILEAARTNLASRCYLLRLRCILVLSGSKKKEDEARIIASFIEHYENPNQEFLATAIGQGRTAYDALGRLYQSGLHFIAQRDKEILSPLLDHQNVDVRETVAIILGDDSRSLPILLEMLEAGVEQRRRGWAVAMLGNHHDVRAIAALEHALEDDSLADVAYSSLLKLGVKVTRIEGNEGEKPVYEVIKETEGK